MLKNSTCAPAPTHAWATSAPPQLRGTWALTLSASHCRCGCSELSRCRGCRCRGCTSVHFSEPASDASQVQAARAPGSVHRDAHLRPREHQRFTYLPPSSLSHHSSPSFSLSCCLSPPDHAAHVSTHASALSSAAADGEQGPRLPQHRRALQHRRIRQVQEAHPRGPLRPGTHARRNAARGSVAWAGGRPNARCGVEC
eukprot:4289138-Pleurochrysis_carterae.AAC.1